MEVITTKLRTVENEDERLRRCITAERPAETDDEEPPRISEEETDDPEPPRVSEEEIQERSFYVMVRRLRKKGAGFADIQGKLARMFPPAVFVRCGWAYPDDVAEREQPGVSAGARYDPQAAGKNENYGNFRKPTTQGGTNRGSIHDTTTNDRRGGNVASQASGLSAKSPGQR